MKFFFFLSWFLIWNVAAAAFAQTPGPFEQFPFEDCTDGIDNDADGDVDCYDSQCILTLHELCFVASPTPVVNSLSVLRPISAQGALASTSAGLAVVAVASTLLSLGSAMASAQSGPELLRSLLPFSAVHRRQVPWGRVAEVRSNKPIAGVVLSLIDEGGKVRATEKARRDGTFGFFVPAGTYRLIAQQGGYQFPAPAPDVALFPGESVYDGGWVTVREESVLALVVVGQGLAQTWVKTWLQGMWGRVQVWQARLAMPLLLVGSGLTLLSFWNRPSVLLGILLGVYVVLFGLELLLSRVARRAVGVVRDALTKQGVGLAVVRLLDEGGRLAATRVTLESGHFFLMPAPGRYRVEIVHRSYQPYTKDPFRVRKFFFGVAGIRAHLLPKQG